MAPTGNWTNQEVLEKIIAQAQKWYEQGVRLKQLFHIGKILHMVQDSYSHSHVIRVDHDEPLRREDGLEFKVRTGDTLETVAAQYKLTWQELAQFNWGTTEPTVINVKLYKEVGCRTPGQPFAPANPYANYSFSDNDVKYGTGKILIPRARRKNQIVSFQSYTDQDENKHGEADKITGGSWTKIPGALDARNASAMILTLFKDGKAFSEVEKYLREVVYPFAPRAAEATAGGTDPAYKK